MKNKEEQTAPKLRFKGYTDAWQQGKLGEITKLTMGQSPHGTTYSKTPSDYILVQGNADLENGWVKPRIWTTKVTKTAKKGDLIFSVRAPVGEVGKTNYDVVIGRGVAAIQGNEFIYNLLIRLNKSKYWDKLSSGSTFKSITSADLENAVINFPNNIEQKRIGNLLSKLDNTITLLQRKKKKYENLKKALLQNLFPKNKKFIPDVRFKNFTDLWQPRRLGDIGSISAGGDVDKQKLSSKPSYPVIANALTNEGIIGYYQDYKIEAPAVTVTGRGSIGHAKARFVNFTPIVRLLVIKTAQNPIFLENSINQTMIYNESTGVPQLTVPQLTKYKISISSIPEQNKIGQLLSKLDDTITLLQKQINTLTSLKQFLLQNMFI